MPSQEPKHRLYGRDAELATLGQFAADVRAGTGRALVLRGEPGVGKTALLDRLAGPDTRCRVVRVVGMESEMELAYAGLYQVCAPLLDGLDQLPPPQRDALSTAFGLQRGDPPDRFLVGLALLTLLSATAEREPLIVIVDDAQWLDRSSAQALGFVARRLLADSIGLVFASRTLTDDADLQGLPEVLLAGLRPPDARSLLDAVLPGRLDDGMRDQLLADAGGNPLAILELPRGLTARQLAEGYATPAARPLASRIEQSFLRRLDALSPDGSLLLLLAAADPTGDAWLVRDAAAHLGVAAGAEAEAEDTELVRFNPRIQFRHPLVRSAVYRAAGGRERQRAHGALAAVTDPAVDPDRRAWHRAHAASVPDETVAGELEERAERARQRGGVAAAAAFLERAAALTPDPTRQATRLLAAAQATFEAADPDGAQQLLAAIRTTALADHAHAQLLWLRAQIAFAQRRGRDAPRLFLGAARALESIDVLAAREAYLDALAAASFAGPWSDVSGRDVALAARAAPAATAPRTTDLLLDALAASATDGTTAGLPLVRDAVASFRRQIPVTRDETVRWLARACPIAEEAAAHDLWDLDAWSELADRAVQLARDTGALAFLPQALVYAAGSHLFRGEFRRSAELLDESARVIDATGLVAVSYATLVLTAWRGDEEATLALTDDALRDATARGEGVVAAVTGYARAVVHNAHERYDAAHVAASAATAIDELAFTGWALVELIEAGVRTGQQVAAPLERLESRARASGTDWALGVLARSRALADPGADADAAHLEAIERLRHSGVAVHHARAHLVYGEWLHREQRRDDAREQLRLAHDMFVGFGAAAFAARARRALVAMGASPGALAASTAGDLTAQESQIAALAAAGSTNAEIGSQLFVSPRTVEYHLAKVYAKLGIRSRRDLRAALAAAHPRPPIV